MPAKPIHCIGFSADGQLLYVPGPDNVVLAVRITDGHVRAAYTGNLADLCCMALSPDGRYLATGADDGSVRLFDSGTGQVLCAVREPPYAVLSIGLSADSGRLLSVGSHGRSISWSVPAGARLEDAWLDRGGIIGASVSPDGKLLATIGHDHVVRLWAVEGFRLLRQFLLADPALSAVCFGNGLASMLVCDPRGTITVLNLRDGSRAGSFRSDPRAHAGAEAAGAFDADAGFCVWAGEDRAVVHRLPTGEVVATIPLAEPATAVALHVGTQQVAIGSALGSITVWPIGEPDRGRALVRHGELLRHGEAPATQPLADENVQFTAYRPEVVRPATWYPLLAFAHLSERRQDADEDEPDPVEEVKRQARTVLGEQADQYKEVTQDSRQAVPREGELVFVPELEGVEFNPPRRSFLWLEPVHREEFRFRASEGLEGKTARGRLSVYLGSILLAEVNLSIRVAHAAPALGQKAPSMATSARPYRKIFASYSHLDSRIVDECQMHARLLGDRYLRDCIDLNAGETWSGKLQSMIDEADVFQLFWSRNSMRSDFVRQEWEYALSLRRANFVRPTYWEEPLPEDPARGLPPRELQRLHFQMLGVGPGAHGPAPAMPAAPLKADVLPDGEIEGAMRESEGPQLAGAAHEEAAYDDKVVGAMSMDNPQPGPPGRKVGRRASATGGTTGSAAPPAPAKRSRGAMSEEVAPQEPIYRGRGAMSEEVAPSRTPTSSGSPPVGASRPVSAPSPPRASSSSPVGDYPEAYETGKYRQRWGMGPPPGVPHAAPVQRPRSRIALIVLTLAVLVLVVLALIWVL